MANIKEVIAKAESVCARLDLHCTQREHRADAINPQQVRENNQLRPFDGDTPAARGDGTSVKYKGYTITEQNGRFHIRKEGKYDPRASMGYWTTDTLAEAKREIDALSR